MADRTIGLLPEGKYLVTPKMPMPEVGECFVLDPSDARAGRAIETFLKMRSTYLDRGLLPDAAMFDVSRRDGKPMGEGFLVMLRWDEAAYDAMSIYAQDVEKDGFYALARDIRHVLQRLRGPMEHTGYDPNAIHYKLVYPTGAPPVQTMYWDQFSWIRFIRSHRPAAYAGGDFDKEAWMAYVDGTRP